MNKIYAYIYNNRVKEIIKSEGVFTNIPLEKRYSKDIVDNCIECNENVKEGMDYNWETGEFSEHIDEELTQIRENEIVEEVIEDGTEE